MEFFINSEKYHSTAKELSCQEVIKMSGFPIHKSYKIIDEKSNSEFTSDDIISIENNMSLMIQEVN